MTTPQEAAWAGKMGDDYTERQTLTIESRRIWLSRTLDNINPLPETIIEFGAGTGDNLRALRLLLPEAHLTALELNLKAMGQIDADLVRLGSILDPDLGGEDEWDLCMTRGLLIHIPPEKLPIAYATLYHCSEHYILIAEYYSPKPVEIEYRGQMGLLWKRDFAGEMMDRYPDLKLVDYGFVYDRDPIAPQDNVTWFMMEKRP